MSIQLENPEKSIQELVSFLYKTYKDQGIKTGVIGVSGGIDSALSLTLLKKAIGADNVHALLLPYKTQSISDGMAICKWNSIPEDQIHVINIEKMVDQCAYVLEVGKDDARLGNIMARVRMVTLYDWAKKLGALVCGTENKSEHHLGYFTRYGDEASDIEPIRSLYKTQVRQLAKLLSIPQSILEKDPSAELWENQTDEGEFGFTYEEADKVIEAYIQNREVKEVEDVSVEVVDKVLHRIKSQQFKHEVPYTP